MNNSEEINKFLDTYNPPRLNHKVKNLNRLVSKEIESIIKNLPQNKSLGSDGFIGELDFQRRLIRFSNSSKILKKKEHFQTHFTRPELEHCIFKNFSHINAYFFTDYIFQRWP